MSRLAKVMIALLAIAVFATPALAEYKFSVYGSARMATFYTDTDQADTQHLSWDLQSNSRFGMKASKDAISGQVEYGTGVNVRLLYGTYKFEGVSFTIGQTYGPFIYSSAQVFDTDNGFAGFGDTYLARRPLVTLAFDNGFSVWAIRNNQSTVDDNVELPILAVKYAGAAGNFSYQTAAGFQTYENAFGEDVDSYLVSFGGTIDINPAAIQFNLGYGQNAGVGGLGLVGAKHSIVGDENSDFMTGYVQAGFNISNSAKIVAGVGYQSEDNDTFVDADNQMAVFVNSPITIAPGFIIVPEINYVDGMDEADGSDGDEYYAVGAKWQINF